MYVRENRSQCVKYYNVTVYKSNTIILGTYLCISVPQHAMWWSGWYEA